MEQGEQNVLFGKGSVTHKEGYACQQAAMIASWREAWSSVPGTTDKQFPFGITSLAGGCSEAFPLWYSSDQLSRLDLIVAAHLDQIENLGQMNVQ